MRLRNTFNKKSNLCLISLLTLNFFNPGQKASARDVFNPAFLGISDDGQMKTDLSIFDAKNMQAPGKYRVDIWLNDEMRETTDINFTKNENHDRDDTSLLPCLSLKQLISYGLKAEQFPALKEDHNGCVDIRSIPGAESKFDFTTQRLLLSIPQAALSQTARGYVSPEEYDDGINALILNYQFTGANDIEKNNSSQSLNLNPGANLGAWRLRNFSTWNKNTDSTDKWDTVYTYAQRNINALQSTLTLGESSALSDMFDSVPFRGLQLATDDSMEPESKRGYAPVVRGIAKSNAKVSIKQNGYLIYQTYVAPGAFEISDMYSTGGSGDLYVTVEETDGSHQDFVVPYASLPLLRREGSYKYEVTTGEYRPYDNSVDKTPFTHATISYGLPLNTTMYGGFQAASKYQSLIAGMGNNLGELGAISTDVTQAWSKKKDEDKTSGQSWRIRYSKNLVDLGTNFSIAGYRYSTKGFNTLQEVLDTWRSDNSAYFPNNRVRNRTELSVSQSLGHNAGYLNLSGIIEDYWEDSRRNTSLNTGYSNSWAGNSFTLNYSYGRYSQSDRGTDEYSQSEHLFSFSVSVPLSQWLPNSWAHYALDTGHPGSTTNRIGLSGTALERDNLNWSIQEGYNNKDRDSGSLNVDYHGGYGEISAGYDYDHYSQRINYGAGGSIVVHQGGMTFGQPLGDTAALIKADGVKNADVFNQTGVSTDYRGYALVPYMTPYQHNDITLDTQSLDDNVELETATQIVVPTRGAIVRSTFNGNIGVRAFIRLTNRSGNVIPFGAMVTNGSESNQSSIVGDNGIVYLSGLSDSGRLKVQWGNRSDQQCSATWTLNPNSGSTGIHQLTSVCQ